MVSTGRLEAAPPSLQPLPINALPPLPFDQPSLGTSASPHVNAPHLTHNLLLSSTVRHSTKPPTDEPVCMSL